jgi:hypothetical protein
MGGPMLSPDVAERFSRNIQPDNRGCWIWTGTRDRLGYGRFGLNGRQPGAHRISWELHRGDIPSGMNVCHQCDVPNCVNPDHLFLGTQKDNLHDCSVKGRTPRGEKQGRSKLKTADVLEIRRLAGMTSQRSIALRFGVSQSTVCDIIAGRKWCHV